MIDTYELRMLADSCTAELEKCSDPKRAEAYRRVIEICNDPGRGAPREVMIKGRAQPVASFSGSGMTKTHRIEMAHAALSSEADNQSLAYRSVILWAMTEIAKNWWRRDIFAGAAVKDL